MRDRLTTRDRLFRWGIVANPTCLLCNASPENIDHIFFNCAFSSHIWYFFFYHNSLSPPVGLHPIVRWVNSSSWTSKVTTICKMVLHAVIYKVWKERNYRLHQNTSKLSNLIVKDIQLTVRGKLSNIDCEEMRDNDPNTNLFFRSTWFGFFQLQFSFISSPPILSLHSKKSPSSWLMILALGRI